MIADRNNDGFISVFVDKEGTGRGIGRFINDNNLAAIDRAVDELTNITGINFRYVDSEAKSELSFHKVDDLELWGQPSNVKGIQSTSRDGMREHVYWEPAYHHEYAEFVIYHELGHAMGLRHPSDPFETRSDYDIMGYQWAGGSSHYTDFNAQQLRQIWS